MKDPKKINKTIDSLRKQMLKAASDLNFELAAELRDKINKLEKSLKEGNKEKLK